MLMYLGLKLKEFSFQVLIQRIKGKWPHCLLPMLFTQVVSEWGTADSIDF